MSLLLLALALLACLVLVPLGLPGTWLMVAVAMAFPYIVGAEPLGAVTLVALVGLALVGELIEFTLSARYTRKYGGSRRASWGAVIGGIVGAMVGVPVPIVGPVIGGFLGSFAGALLAEISRGSGHGAATRVAWGALIGRVVATAVKMGIGVAIAAWALLAAASSMAAPGS
jgi:uncharacterized protein YqgC (DUF456 family)